MEKRNRFQAIQDNIDAASKQYRELAERAELHALDAQKKVGEVTAAEMSRLYKNNLARKGSSGRGIYDYLISRAPHGLCLLCNARSVGSLDHHAPKSLYPAHALNPLNLIPACLGCNQQKNAHFATHRSDQTCHPYFLDLGDLTWIEARVTASRPMSAVYGVCLLEDQDPDVWLQVKNHFDTFNLSKIYGAKAGEEFANMDWSFRKWFEAAGAKGLTDRVSELHEGFRNYDANSWRTALYAGLLNSDWFLGGSFVG